MGKERKEFFCQSLPGSDKVHRQRKKAVSRLITIGRVGAEVNGRWPAAHTCGHNWGIKTAERAQNPKSF
jgi:hypothetical protein